MANAKISALTSATTPLAGTEVLPIVQSSATVKVATNDLTVRNVRANATTGILQVTGPTAATTRVMTVPDANFTAARTDAAQSFTGDQTLSTGNLVIGTSGKGIDFSATAGAGTSELLADYEEGTWTAAFVPSTSGSITLSAATGTYTKMGRAVTVNGLFTVGSVSSPLGYLKITGLPFNGGTGAQFRCALAINNENMNATMNTVLVANIQSDSNIYVFKNDGVGGIALTTAADVKAGTNIFIGGTYLTS